MFLLQFITVMAVDIKVYLFFSQKNKTFWRIWAAAAAENTVQTKHTGRDMLCSQNEEKSGGETGKEFLSSLFVFC